MHSRRFGSWPLMAVALCLALVAVQPPTQAQVTTATVYGRVIDPSGAVIPGASVAASSEATGAEFSTVTGAGGEFTLTFLPAGTYTLAITAEGFKSYLETGLTLASGQRHNRDYGLELGATAEDGHRDLGSAADEHGQRRAGHRAQPEPGRRTADDQPRHHRHPDAGNRCLAHGRRLDALDQRPRPARLHHDGGCGRRRARRRVRRHGPLSELQLHQGHQCRGCAGSRDVEEHLLGGDQPYDRRQTST